jgi:hypothetical protein
MPERSSAFDCMSVVSRSLWSGNWSAATTVRWTCNGHIGNSPQREAMKLLDANLELVDSALAGPITFAIANEHARAELELKIYPVA